MRGIRGLVVGACLLVLAPFAHAQQTQPRSLSELLDSMPAREPSWLGRAAFPAAPGAVGRVNAGRHGVGDVIAEIEIRPSRTARLVEAVTLTDATHGEHTIAAGAILVARNGEQGESRPGGRIVVTDRGPLQWCALEDGAAPLCIRWIAANAANYREMGAPGRLWRGPAPVLREESIAFDPPLTWRFAIKAIDPTSGASFSSTIGRGDRRVKDRGFGAVPSGVGIDMGEQYPGLRFRLRIDGAERVIVETQ